MQTRWGIDLGGTKIEGVVLRAGDTTPLFRDRIPTQADQGYRHILSRIREMIEAMERSTGLPRPEQIGIGTPGSLDRASGLLRNSNTVCLNGQPLKADLEKECGISFRFANDADCFALAEASLGSGRGCRTVFGVIMGTGVGGGLVVEGRLIEGPNGLTGEWGHNTLDPNGKPCYCGRRGCVETVISGKALERYYTSLTRDECRLQDIFADLSDPAVRATYDRLLSQAAKALAVVVNVLDPDVIVLGGGVGQSPELAERLPEAMAPWIFHPNPQLHVVRPSLGDSAGVFGAAQLSC